MNRWYGRALALGGVTKTYPAASLRTSRTILQALIWLRSKPRPMRLPRGAEGKSGNGNKKRLGHPPQGGASSTNYDGLVLGDWGRKQSGRSAELHTC